ncbi:hypothetical protein A6770_10050 [Nostoc minutum NIES-26]|uniref:Uncharacterized protein n=1 Tax=Nostoc minutum NIES-26 TaxID=1844469 RepID=A0A367RY32_9NOSO|nr:hypothetical protein [Dendronalium sp. ChiSLP03b]MDZ8205769.1 hypothetical protein [Dendronalium sp. ChiSLP03b]RCJ40741.1 hypothetical protein A6770_10050 [Nostoc minutum NIES-26]
MDTIDKLLAQIKAEYDEAKSEKQQPKINVVKPFVPPPPKSVSLVDNLLAEVQADFAAQDKAEELRRQQELEQERIRQEKIKATKLETLKNQAKEWLDKLDPFSPEGLWFERFSESYPSKLEAAIEYLQSNE